MQNNRMKYMLKWVLFVALVVVTLTLAYFGAWNYRNRYLNKAAHLVAEATSVVTSEADADWVWSVKTNSLSNSERAQWALFFKERHRPLFVERKSVEHKRLVFRTSDGVALFSLHIMKPPLIIVRIDDRAYEFECIRKRQHEGLNACQP